MKHLTKVGVTAIEHNFFYTSHGYTKEDKIIKIYVQTLKMM